MYIGDITLIAIVLCFGGLFWMSYCKEQRKQDSRSGSDVGAYSGYGDRIDPDRSDSEGGGGDGGGD
jgi:hypothetical protein